MTTEEAAPPGRHRDHGGGRAGENTKWGKIYQELCQRVARNVARLRAEQGLTLQKLGALAGLHWRHLQKIEHGEVNLTLSTMTRLAKGLDVDPTELMDEPPASGRSRRKRK